MKIRTLCPGDLVEVARRCFPHERFDDALDRLRDELAAQAQGLGWTLVAETNGAPCGALRLERHRRTGWIHNLAVAEAYRGRGVAGRLLAEAEALCRRSGATALLLHVRRDNPAARRAYEKAGFRFVSTDGMRGDQLRYRKDLDGGPPRGPAPGG